jgi:hypothetical protein
MLSSTRRLLHHGHLSGFSEAGVSEEFKQRFPLGLCVNIQTTVEVSPLSPAEHVDSLAARCLGQG